jgi:hypothetical protein
VLDDLMQVLARGLPPPGGAAAAGAAAGTSAGAAAARDAAMAAHGPLWDLPAGPPVSSDS